MDSRHDGPLNRILDIFDEADRARAAPFVGDQVAHWREAVEKDRHRQEPKELKKELQEIAAAMETISRASENAWHLVKVSAAPHGVRLSRKEVASVGKTIHGMANNLQLSEGGRPAFGRSRGAKDFSIIAAAVIVRHVLGRRDLWGHALADEFGQVKFLELAEVMFEAIAGDGQDCAGQLEAQIKKFNQGKLNLSAHSLNFGAKG